MLFNLILLGIAIAGGAAGYLAHLAGYPEVGIAIVGVVAAFLGAVVVAMKRQDQQ